MFLLQFCVKSVDSGTRDTMPAAERHAGQQPYGDSSGMWPAITNYNYDECVRATYLVDTSPADN